MQRQGACALAFALLVFAVPGAAFAAGVSMTPLTPGFHQRLQCNGGYVTVAVAPGPGVAPDAVVVTTAFALGPSLSTTRALRSVDAAGNIYGLGYVAANGVNAVKRFPKLLLLPAAPPVAGERSRYYNLSGTLIDKHFEGTQPATGAHGEPATGYVFADYFNGRKISVVTYVPSAGIVEAHFLGMLPNGGDFICRPFRG